MQCISFMLTRSIPFQFTIMMKWHSDKHKIFKLLKNDEPQIFSTGVGIHTLIQICYIYQLSFCFKKLFKRACVFCHLTIVVLF